MNSNVFNIINVYEYWCWQHLTSTTFLMCLLTTEGSGLVVTPEAQSSGARGLLGVVGEVGCRKKHGCYEIYSVLCWLLQKKPFPAKIPWERGRNHMLQLQLWTQYQMGYSIRQDNLMKSSLKWPTTWFGVGIFFFLKRILMFIKAAFIWSKIQ